MNHELEHDRLICMVGTDHALASAEVRSAFSLASEARDAALPFARVSLGASGVVLLATCNRTELWVSFDGACAPARSIDDAGTPKADDPVFSALCAMHNVDPAQYAQYFVCRSGDAAASHLFHVACGLKSAIVAEDQVVSQVKQSIALARELGVADSCLEVLFRQAITAAKQVKSNVRFTRAYATAVDQAIDILTRDGVDLSSSTCMVIGNGEYGRLAATTLQKLGAKVLVTVRQYTHGNVSVPAGCTGVPYAERFNYIDQCNVIASATTSPHYTIDYDQFCKARKSDAPMALLDLAIPHDIDARIADAPGCALYDIDSFTTQVGTENAQAIEAARKVLDSGMAEFWDWIRRREIAVQERQPESPFFPLFVDLSSKRLVSIGGGTNALRRIRVLLPFVGDIIVAAPEFTPDVERFARDGIITLVRKPYEESLLENADIVLACTNDADVNEQVWQACKERNIMVNVCTDRYKCDFHIPSVAQHGNVVVGVSANGREHRRVKQLRTRIDRLMNEEDV